MPDRPRGGAQLSVLILLWLSGIYMRAPILVAAPLGERIRAALDFGQTGLGALNTLPVLMLGLGAVPAAWLIGRFGARNTLIAALALTALASALRGMAPDLALLLAATAAMGLGISAMQPALPALVGRWCPGFVALGSTVYMNGMMCGEFIGAGLTLPFLLPATGDNWRHALLVLSVPAVVIAPLLLLPRLHGTRTQLRAARHLPDWRDPQIWRFGLLLGATASTFFGTNAYMSGILAAKGLSDQLDRVLIVFNFTQLAASFLMISAVHRILRVPRLLGAAVLCHIVAVGGLIVLSGLPLLLAVAVLLSFASALQLIALTALPPLTREPDDAGRLAAGMFAIGYASAFVLPITAGLFADAFGTASAVLWVFLGCNVAALSLAWRTSTTPTETKERRPSDTDGEAK